MRNNLHYALVSVLAFMIAGGALPAYAENVRSHSRNNVNANRGGNANRSSNTNSNRNTNVNQNTNINRNSNVNVNQNVNVNVNVDSHGYGGCCYNDYHP